MKHVGLHQERTLSSPTCHTRQGGRPDGDVAGPAKIGLAPSEGVHLRPTRKTALYRRHFLKGATAIGLMSPLAIPHAFTPTPLQALPRKRFIFPRLDQYGAWLLHSDGPEAPPPTVRRDVIDKVFGTGTYDTLYLPDHWAMIEAGWFSGTDLHHPIPVVDEVYDVWRAFHHPVCEAHDLIADVFDDLYSPAPGCPGMLRLGIEMAEHPCTPRMATARIRSDHQLSNLAAELARRTDSVAIVPPE